MEIIEDQLQSSQSTSSQDNANIPKKKKSRKSKKQNKQPVDNQPAKSGKLADNQEKTKKKGKKFIRGQAAEKIITGINTTEANMANVHHITVYDIPVEWTQEEILQALNSWGNTIKCSTKKQRKFQTLWVKIILNDETRVHFDGGLWMYTLNNSPIRWFPGDWSLKDRKNRERFCLVWRNCPESQHT
ncbi:hypothetical protein RclHR1_19600004 [Rhizophagus clarus]|uniref:Uncharacterized protein n=1 Tax=Rhizophagus clarus TaxID=94130 RepID=A0A2Z6R545_9GLOM|nr:hypothetical protein RclHR1_19600004 [Rhizophagus clarus]